MNTLNNHDANDMQSHKHGEAMFDEYDIFCSLSFEMQSCFDDSMPLLMMIILMKVGLEECQL